MKTFCYCLECNRHTEHTEERCDVCGWMTVTTANRRLQRERAGQIAFEDWIAEVRSSVENAIITQKRNQNV